MLETIAQEFSDAVTLLQISTPYALGIIGVLYAIHFVNWILGYRLNLLGIHPRKIWGLIGIPCSPFLHGNFNHLFFNSIPLFVLMSLLLITGMNNFITVSAIIIVMSGAGTWLIGRTGVHVGASSLIMGYWSYLMANAYHQGTLMAVALGVICAYYFGSLILNLFPQGEKTSLEGHIFGFLAGLVAAYWNVSLIW